eukprot:Gb_25306 [translate_table: standard]
MAPLPATLWCECIGFCRAGALGYRASNPLIEQNQRLPIDTAQSVLLGILIGDEDYNFLLKSILLLAYAINFCLMILVGCIHPGHKVILVLQNLLGYLFQSLKIVFRLKAVVPEGIDCNGWANRTIVGSTCWRVCTLVRNSSRVVPWHRFLFFLLVLLPFFNVDLIKVMQCTRMRGRLLSFLITRGGDVGYSPLLRVLRLSLGALLEACLDLLRLDVESSLSFVMSRVLLRDTTSIHWEGWCYPVHPRRQYLAELVISCYDPLWSRTKEQRPLLLPLVDMDGTNVSTSRLGWCGALAWGPRGSCKLEYLFCFSKGMLEPMRYVRFGNIPMVWLIRATCAKLDTFHIPLGKFVRSSGIAYWCASQQNVDSLEVVNRCELRPFFTLVRDCVTVVARLCRHEVVPTKKRWIIDAIVGHGCVLWILNQNLEFFEVPLSLCKHVEPWQN